MGIFNMDGGLVKSLGKITDMICLSILFIISSIPVFTIGTAATALYYTVYKVIRNDRGYIFKEYVNAFKNNFKQTTPVWLLVMLISVVLGADIYIVRAWGENGSKIGALVVVFLVLAAFLLGWVLYLFAYMARFENTRKQSMKNAVLIGLIHLPWTVLLIVMALAAAVVMYITPVTIFFVPSLFTLLESFILEKIFWKYMSEEDRNAELERNREFKN